MPTTLAIKNLCGIVFFASVLIVVRSFQCINDLVLLTIQFIKGKKMWGSVPFHGSSKVVGRADVTGNMLLLLKH